MGHNSRWVHDAGNFQVHRSHAGYEILGQHRLGDGGGGAGTPRHGIRGGEGVARRTEGNKEKLSDRGDDPRRKYGPPPIQEVQGWSSGTAFCFQW